jgi:MFS family permease
MTALGLVGMTIGVLAVAVMPTAAGIAGYVVPIAVITAGYALFQAANNTAVMADIDPARRGVISGLLNLSRNLGLITGASAMGAVFALGSGAADIATASPEAVAHGLRVTFAVAAVLIASAIAIVAGRCKTGR